MDNYISAVLDGADKVGRAEGVVYHQGQAVAVGYLRDGVDIGDVGVGVAQGLEIDGLGVVFNGPLKLAQIVRVHEGGRHAELGQGVGQQVMGAAVDGLLGHDMVPRLGQGLYCIRDSRRAGGRGKGRCAALQSRHALLEHVLGGVCQPAVDIPRVRKTKPRRRVGGILEHV